MKCCSTQYCCQLRGRMISLTVTSAIRGLGHWRGFSSMQPVARRLVSIVAVSILVCLTSLPAVSAQASPATSSGALIRMSMDSTVGVLLDELPAGPLREQAASNALAIGTDFWLARARRQLRLMNYRLVFRGAYYSSSFSSDPHVRGPLPLPPPSVWDLQLVGSPYRTKLNGHDVVVVDYTFGSYIVTDVASPAQVEPNLASIGGIASETFNLPADPELLFERTGYACMDEFEFPPGSVFEENTWYFYDDSCTVGSKYCHITSQPQLSCGEALVRKTGLVRPTLNFTRIAYDATTAERYRIGTVNPKAVAAGAAADLAVVAAGMTDERVFAYRFFAPGSCELGEGVIGKLGWRRLLLFSAIVQNDGTAPIDLGDVSDPNNPYVQSNAFEYSACHQHYHFRHYGTFAYGGSLGSKRAFCLEDTNRYHNDETTPLTAQHQTCRNQGIGAGWGDEYNFGLPGQWVDVTTVNTTKPTALTFQSNPDQFLCEGTLVRDASGSLIFDPTSFLNTAGQTEYRARCNFLSMWNSNNLGSVMVSSPGGSFVTDTCTRGQIGPNRNCGFAGPQALASCATGKPIQLTCTATGAVPIVLRVCEISGQLVTGVACTLADAVANFVIGTTPTPVAFACPAVRDAAMVVDTSDTLVPTSLPGVGGYSLYRAKLGTLAANDATPPPAVSCSGG